MPGCVEQGFHEVIKDPLQERGGLNFEHVTGKAQVFLVLRRHGHRLRGFQKRQHQRTKLVVRCAAGGSGKLGIAEGAGTTPAALRFAVKSSS